MCVPTIRYLYVVARGRAVAEMHSMFPFVAVSAFAAETAANGASLPCGANGGGAVAMGLRFKTESHGGQRDSSLRERGLLLWGGDGTPFAVNRDSFCRQSGLLLPCNVATTDLG